MNADAACMERRHVGRFRRVPGPGERALTPGEAVQLAGILRRLALVATHLLLGALRLPAGAPALGGPLHYYRLAVRIELGLAIGLHEAAWLEEACRVYRPLLERVAASPPQGRI